MAWFPHLDKVARGELKRRSARGQWTLPIASHEILNADMAVSGPDESLQAMDEEGGLTLATTAISSDQPEESLIDT